MSSSPRDAAQHHIQTLISLASNQLAGETREKLIAECEALAVSIRAFHMEGIRFRMFNVDRLLSRIEVPAEIRATFGDIRHELEAAGFHTRSHSAPG
jgi:hypothetical protein